MRNPIWVPVLLLAALFGAAVNCLEWSGNRERDLCKTTGGRHPRRQHADAFGWWPCPCTGADSHRRCWCGGFTIS